MAPWRANRSAIALPMTCVPPVIRARFPLNSGYAGLMPNHAPSFCDEERSPIRVCLQSRRGSTLAFIAELHSIDEMNGDLGVQKSDRFPHLLDAIHPVFDRDPRGEPDRI